MIRHRFVVTALTVCAMVTGVLTATVMHAPAALAENGTILRTITAAVPACSVGTGVAFDGTNLLVSCDYTNVVSVVRPSDGALVRNVTISGMTAIGAMAWDRGRGEIWACSGFGNDDARVWLIDVSTGVATAQFTSTGCVDGLAYDGSDDTLWMSDDASYQLYHTTISGSVLNSFPIGSSLGGSCGNSGIAVGGPSLFLSNDGCKQIYQTNKDLSSPTLFGTYPARLEDMECDDVTFASSGKAAIWSKDAYDATLNAFELNPGDCGYGGYASSLTLTGTSQAPVGQGHTERAV